MKAEYINPYYSNNVKYYDLIFIDSNDEIVYRCHLSFDINAGVNEMMIRCLEIAENVFQDLENKIIIEEISVNNKQ